MIYYLGERDAMLVINMSKNTEQVIKFKVALTDAFLELKNNMIALPKNYEEALEHLLVQVREKKAIQAQNTALLLANNKKDEKIKDLEYYESFYKDLIGSSGSIKMSSVAKILNFVDERNKNIGRNMLFAILRDNNYLQKNNEPYQTRINQGLFELEMNIIKTSKGDIVATTTKVTNKGLAKIHKMLEQLGFKSSRQQRLL